MGPTMKWGDPSLKWIRRKSDVTATVGVTDRDRVKVRVAFMVEDRAPVRSRQSCLLDGPYLYWKFGRLERL